MNFDCINRKMKITEFQNINCKIKCMSTITQKEKINKMIPSCVLAFPGMC
jgi:hypothetical protein